MQLEDIKGIGPKTANILRRLGINDSYDLLTYYPFRYDIIKRTDLNDEKVILDGIVESNAVVTYLRNHKDKMQFRFNIGKLVDVVIFNRGFLKNKIIVGTRGWTISDEEEDKKIINREIIRFEMSIKDGIQKYGTEKEGKAGGHCGNPGSEHCDGVQCAERKERGQRRGQAEN